jgi:uroporphyrinogen-III synthase
LPDTSRTGVLITRPGNAGPDVAAAETARRVAALGFTPVLAPVLRIAALPARLGDPALVRAVLLTSGNALGALDAAWHGVPVLAVGDATAARARAAGFAQVDSAGRDAVALAALVAARCPAGAVLLLPTARGEGLALACTLRAAGFVVRRRAVYAALPHAALPDAAVAALVAGTVRAALFFSPAAARGFVRLARMLPAACLGDIAALALSPAVAAPLAALPWHRLRVADRPTQDALLTLLAESEA